MEINGREVGFAWTVGAYCDYSDYVAAHEKVSVARANVRQALAMNKAYNELNDIKTGALTEKELLKLPFSALTKIQKEMEKVMAEDSKTTVDIKNAKGAAEE